MRIILIVSLLAYNLAAMDLVEEELHPEQKLQLRYDKQVITTESFATIITQHPKLHELIIDGHTIQNLPAQKLHAADLTTIAITNGPLAGSNTLRLLLTICPLLQKCSLAHNQLTTLDEYHLPYRIHLTELDCNNNLIDIVDFSQLYQQLPNLADLNLSNCPLKTFNTADVIRNTVIPKINLQHTQLSDNAKRTILLHATAVSNVHQCDGQPISKDKNKTNCCNMVPISMLGGGGLGALFGGALALNCLCHPEMVVIFAGVGFVTGPVIGHFGKLCCTNPEDREVTVFIPIFDAEPAHTEKEITTGYQRFVRHFPYIGNIKKLWKRTDAEYAQLTETAEQ
jgi:hypothetical protein